MKTNFKKILIACDLSNMDDYLFSMCKIMLESSSIEELHLIHIIPPLISPKNKDPHFQQSYLEHHPIEDKIITILQKKLEDYVDTKKLSTAIHIIEGKAYYQLTKWIKDKQIDLLIVGNKEEHEGSGITSRRLARKVNCHILFVPKKAVYELDEVLVPIDFSENSAKALMAAIDLKKNQNTITSALHVVETLPSDAFFGLDQNELYLQKLVDNAKEHVELFIDCYSLPEKEFEIEIILNKHKNLSTQINNYCKNNKADLVVMGAQGHSVFENFIYGSVTESFVEKHRLSPILIIRNN